jgi:hypothetical protein
MIYKFNEYNNSRFPKSISLQDYNNKLEIHRNLPFTKEERLIIIGILRVKSKFINFEITPSAILISDITEYQHISAGIIAIHKLEDDWFIIKDTRSPITNTAFEYYICDEFEELESYLISL